MLRNRLVVCANEEVYTRYLVDNCGWDYAAAKAGAAAFIPETLFGTVWQFWTERRNPELEIELENDRHAWYENFRPDRINTQFVVGAESLEEEAFQLNDRIVAALRVIELSPEVTK